MNVYIGVVTASHSSALTLTVVDQILRGNGNFHHLRGRHVTAESCVSESACGWVSGWPR